MSARKSDRRRFGKGRGGKKPTTGKRPATSRPRASGAKGAKRSGGKKASGSGADRGPASEQAKPRGVTGAPGKKSREAGSRRKATPRKARSQRISEAMPDREAGADDAPAIAPSDVSTPAGDFFVVGIGMSAGGLEAARAMLEALPHDVNLAFVLISHLMPHQESLLSELLGRSTKLEVVDAREGLQPRPGVVCVIPPGCSLTLSPGGALHLDERRPDVVPHPIDGFFRSLASVYGSRSVGVVLSGTGSDGAQGLREIKAAAGLVLVQDPATAEHQGMPRAALQTDAVDRAASPAALAEELLRIASAAGEARRVEPREEQLGEIFDILRHTSDIDFSGYKRPTLLRRLERRMVVKQVRRLDDYIRMLRELPEEAAHLAREFLIQVTSFFREPEAFEILRNEIIPGILEAKPRRAPFRAWVPGCATGEEAYSLAMVLLEAMSESRTGGERPLQIFATDVSEAAVDHARAGFYSEGAVAPLSPERLRRFFNRIDSGFRVSQSLREHLVFSRQDVTRDPPFSRLDLVLCRNLLIYLTPAVQRRVIRTLHYALRTGGTLLLGKSESIGASSDLFGIVDRTHRLYVRKDARIHLDEPLAPRSREGPRSSFESATGAGSEQARRLLAEQFSPSAVLVDERFQILESFGRTGLYLELPPGQANLNLLKMARSGLGMPLRRALHECQREGAAIETRALRIRSESGTHSVVVTVCPVPDDDQGWRQMLVVFREEEGAIARPPRSAPAGKRPPSSSETRELRHQLEENQAHMQSMIQDLEAANEELQSANEEILSSNEELQSTNEELDTAREELQSTNEEINTVNEELQGRNEELLRANSDLENLMANADLALVIVSRDLTIRRFTALAGRMFNLISTDVGRPLGQINPSFQLPDLVERVQRVIDDVEPFECETQTTQGGWISLRIRPYKDADRRIDGAVLGVQDVTVTKQHEMEAQVARSLSEAVVQAVRDPLVILDSEHRVTRVNASFRQHFGLSDADVTEMPLWELSGGRWNVPELRRLLDEVLPRNHKIDDFIVAGDFPRIGRQRLYVTARRIEGVPGDFRILMNVRPFAESLAAPTPAPSRAGDGGGLEKEPER